MFNCIYFTILIVGVSILVCSITIQMNEKENINKAHEYSVTEIPLNDKNEIIENVDKEFENYYYIEDGEISDISLTIDVSNVKKQYYDIVFCVTGCDTKEKYRKQLFNIFTTWGTYKGEMSYKILVFLGEEMYIVGDNCIHLKNVKNDYQSCSHKQFIGLQYIHNYYDYKYVFVCCSDIFVNVPKLCNILQSKDCNEYLYIGGNNVCESSFVLGEDGQGTYYHDGGPGFILSYKVVSDLSSILPTIMGKWYETIRKYKIKELHAACDICISYFIKKYVKNINIVRLDDRFTHKYESFDPEVSVTCHDLTIEQMLELDKTLRENNFYV